MAAFMVTAGESRPSGAFHSIGGEFKEMIGDRGPGRGAKAGPRWIVDSVLPKVEAAFSKADEPEISPARAEKRGRGFARRDREGGEDPA
jgi:hypothetical protein